MYVREMCCVCLCMDAGTCVAVRGHPGAPVHSSHPFPACFFSTLHPSWRLDLVSKDSPVYASCLTLGVARVTDNCAILSGF